MRSLTRRLLLRSSALLVTAALLGAGSAIAATITVDGAGCTLADAIAAANTDAVVAGSSCTAGSGADTLDLQADVTLAAADGTSSLVGGARAGLPDVTSEIAIQGNGHTIARLKTLGCSAASEGTDFRLLQVTGGGKLTLSGAVLANGCVVDATEAQGGAVLTEGTADLTIAGCTLANNRALGLDATGAAPAGRARGGAVYALDASVLISGNSKLSHNVAQAGDDALGNGAGADASGGAVQLVILSNPSARIGIKAAQLDGNLALAGRASAGQPGGNAAGGAVNGPLSGIQDAIFTGNSAIGGAASGETGGVGYGGAIASNLVGDVDGLVVRGNVARGGAADGAVVQATGGVAIGGGARLDPVSGAVRHLTRAWFDGNWSIGGRSATARAGDGRGAGLAVWGNSGTLVVSGATLSGNHAVGGDGPGNDASDYAGLGQGAGLELATTLPSPVELDLLNVTLYGNVATGGSNLDPGGSSGEALGAGVATFNGPLVVASSTIAGNSGGWAGPVAGGAEGVGAYIGGPFTLGNTVIAGNTAPGQSNADCFDGGPAGTYTSAGYNWLQAPSGSCTQTGTGDHVSHSPPNAADDPGLGAFGDHGCAVPLPGGGCAPTVALPATSPLIDRGSATAAVAVTTDGRGGPRPVDLSPANADDGADTGAFELGELQISLDDSADPVDVLAASPALTDTVTLANPGGGAVTAISVTVTCTLPAGVGFGSPGSAVGSTPACAGSSCTWSGFDLAAGATATYTLPFTFQPGGVATSTITCTASVTTATPSAASPISDAASTLLVGAFSFGDDFETGDLTAWTGGRAP